MKGKVKKAWMCECPFNHCDGIAEYSKYKPCTVGIRKKWNAVFTSGRFVPEALWRKYRRLEKGVERIMGTPTCNGRELLLWSDKLSNALADIKKGVKQ